MPHGAYRKEETREGLCILRLFANQTHFFLLGLDNNYLFLRKIDPRIFLKELDMDS